MWMPFDPTALFMEIKIKSLIKIFHLTSCFMLYVLHGWIDEEVGFENLAWMYLKHIQAAAHTHSGSLKVKRNKLLSQTNLLLAVSFAG